MMYVWLIVGFILLVKGADFFVDGSASVARTLRVPTLIIGLTIVAFGTSCPEAAVSVTASMQGKNDMAFSNVVGSNIFNLLVVVGASALIRPVKVDRGIMYREFPLSIVIAGVLLFFASGLLSKTGVERGEGIALLVLFVLFVVYMVVSALRNRTDADEEYETMPVWKSLIWIIGGIAAIICGGQLVVNSATEIAFSFGMSEALVGLTIVAFGTSLPELATSMAAARKGESDLALGNAIGSNIFNILMVLGAAAAISPVKVGIESIYDTAILIAFSIIVYMMIWKTRIVTRWKGGIMVLLYLVYTGYIILR